ncbi:MAG: N-acetyl-gamma-glutamyl-phosphate reductase [Phycisphaerales bacterium]
MTKTPVAILGPTGYTGLELIEIVLGHPALELGLLCSARDPAPRIDAEFPRLAGRINRDTARCQPIDHDAIARACPLAFLCLPHDAAMQHAPELLRRGVRVIDLSAAYRLKDSAVYARYYGHPHTDAQNLAHAVYGLPEFNREAIRAARLVANPGCYPTAAALAIVPLLRAGLIDPASIIIHAASGASGAGREAKPHLTLVEAGDNFSAYGLGVHRHQPEIGQSIRLFAKGTEDPLFLPHLLPIARGILETITARPLSPSTDTAALQETLRAAFAGERSVTVRDDAPTLRDVARTNRVHLNARVVCGRVVVVAAIDNLLKGASGQAVQNANLMLGLDEHTGLG